MSDMVNVNIVEDKSVQKAMERKASDLLKKYEKKRKVNENFLKEPKSVAGKVAQVVVCALSGILVALTLLLGVMVLNSRVQNVPASFMGYSKFTLVSASMSNDGFNVGDSVVIRRVNTKTIKRGDKIAFYVWGGSYTKFDVNSCVRVKDDDIGATSYDRSISTFLGFKNSEIKQASNANSMLVFHKVRDVYQDDDGVRWFKTYGSSNLQDDAYMVSENVVLGIHTDSGFANSIASLSETVSSPAVALGLLVPMILLGLTIFYDVARELQIRKLQLDCIEEKRKITDPICVKNNVGLYMDKRSKYKILAQADPDDRLEYIKLLWADGTAPNSVQKYCLRKEMLLRNNRRLLEVNRECQERFKRGDDPTAIAEYYTQEKSKLESAQRAFQRLPKDLAK